MDATESSEPRDSLLERVVFLSDGLFAIALTVLVLELRLPGLPASADESQLEAALRELVPRFFAYALSFSIISLYWMAHWRRFQLIQRADARLAYLNLTQLAFIALIPFPTALIGEHGDLPIAVVLYAVTLSAAGLTGVVAGVYASSAGLTRGAVPSVGIGSPSRRGLIVPAVMIASLLLLPWAGTSAVELSWLAILPVDFVARRWDPIRAWRPAAGLRRNPGSGQTIS